MNATPNPQPTADFAHLLPGVPLVESPFFGRIIETINLDPETRRIAHDLHHKGYAVLDFPEPDLDALAEQIKRDLHPTFDWNMWHSTGHQSGNGLRAWDAWKTHDAIRTLACNAHMVQLLSTLYGRQAFPFQTLNFPVGTQQHVHTDSVHFSCNPERFMCGVWLALEDIDENNGPLVYYPGSHRWPIYTNEHIGVFANGLEKLPGQNIYEDMWRGLIEVHQAQAEVLTCKKGQALIWAANLLHGGSPQLDKNRTRWSQVTHYFFEDCAYYTPLWSDPFSGRVYFRRPFNIGTGGRAQSQYLGQPVSEEFIAECAQERVPFHAADYLAANPDVLASGMSAEVHYMRHGRFEKRRLRPLIVQK
jgi:hypothetical protein